MMVPPPSAPGDRSDEKSGGVGGHGQDVGVRTEHPEAHPVRGVLGRSVPPHRRLTAQGGEHLVGKAVGEEIEIGEIDLVEVRPGPSRRCRGPASGASGSVEVAGASAGHAGLRGAGGRSAGQGWVIDSGRTDSSNCSPVR